MFKNMKLSAKMVSGFGLLIVIAAALGGLAIQSMWNVSTEAAKLANEYVPEVAVANNVERHSLLTMYNIRGYAFKEDDSFLTIGTAEMEKIRSFLKDADDLAARSEHLVTLKGAVDEMRGKVAEYEGLCNQTVTLINRTRALRETLNTSAQSYMDACYSYLKDQTTKFRTELSGESVTAQTQAAEEPAAPAPAVDGAQDAATESKDKVAEPAEPVQAAAVPADAGNAPTGLQKAERLDKITAINDIIDVGNTIRIACYESQALNDGTLIEKVLPEFDKVATMLSELRAVTHIQTTFPLLDQIQQGADQYKAALTQMRDTMAELGTVGKSRTEVGTKVLELAQNLAMKGMENTSTIAGDTQALLARSSWILIVGLSGAAVFGILVALFVTRSITKPINRIIQALGAGSDQVHSAAGQVSQSSQSLAEGASEQASSLEETSASLEEMTAMTRQNTDNANQANAMVAEAGKAAKEGHESMQRMSTAINEIKQASDQTANIIKTIDEIAFQTNLLALNAAVEAARAGDAGKGFAVVAEEVRSLAQRSADAARNTAALIEGAQKSAENGVSVSKEVATMLERITDTVGRVQQLIAEVSAASNEQTSGIDQINNAVAQMNQVTQANAASSEEAAAASEELSAQSEELNHVVEELSQLVGGKKAASPAIERSAPVSSAPMRRAGHAAGTPVLDFSKAPKPARQANGHRPTRTTEAVATGAKTRRPEEVIPLDDSELSEF